MFMSKFKSFFSMLFAVALAGGVIVSCNDDEKNSNAEAEGIKAGTEMCDCVSDYDAPIQPQHPASPLPPANFNPYLDYSDPAVLATLDGATIAYISDPAIQAYFGALASFQAEFTAYAGQLYECLGVIGQYQEYATANAENYNPEAADPLLSVFSFKNDDFKEGFTEGVKSCADSFTALFALMQMQ